MVKNTTFHQEWGHLEQFPQNVSIELIKRINNRLILLLTDQDRHSNLGRKKPQKQLSINNGLNSRLFWKEITSQSLRFFGQNWSCFLFFSVNLFGQVTLTLDKNNNLTEILSICLQRGCVTHTKIIFRRKYSKMAKWFFILCGQESFDDYFFSILQFYKWYINRKLLLRVLLT